MVILNLFHFAACLILPRYPTLEAALAAAAKAGQHLDAVQGRDELTLDPAVVEGFVSFEATVDVNQHGFQRLQVEATQAVAQSVIPKGALGPDPVLEMGVGQFALQLLKAGKTKNKGMEEGQKYAGRRDLRTNTGIPHSVRMGAQIERLIEVSRKRG